MSYWHDRRNGCFFHVHGDEHVRQVAERESLGYRNRLLSQPDREPAVFDHGFWLRPARDSRAPRQACLGSASGAVIGTVSLITTFTAFSVMPMADTTVLLFTSTLFIPVLGVIFLKESVGSIPVVRCRHWFYRRFHHVAAIRGGIHAGHHRRDLCRPPACRLQIIVR